MKHCYAKKALFFFSLIICVYLSAENLLLQAPKKLSCDEIEHRLQGKIDWEFEFIDRAQGAFIRFYKDHRDGIPNLLVRIPGDWPHELPEELHAQFMPVKNEEQDAWIYSYNNCASDDVLFLVSLSDSKLACNEVSELHEPLFYEPACNKPCIEEISLEFAERFIGKQCVVYTGAGLSAAVVPTLNDFFIALNFDFKANGENFLALASAVLCNPAQTMRVLDFFLNGCINGQPTGAHEAIRNLCLKQNWCLLTENIDQLHQKSGIDPFVVASNQATLQSCVTPDDLQKIDYLIVVGQSCDNSGLLGWYKFYNPAGIVVAFDLCKPPYLGFSDIWVPGDIQETIPHFFECCQWLQRLQK